MDPKPCGCKSDQSNDYLFVKATGTEAALCGPTENPTGTESCPIQEPFYDFSQSDFLVPSETGTANMQVCNGSIYTVGQWLYFLEGVHLKISGITGNILTLVNQCAPGVIVDTNPETGFIIHKGFTFVASDRPPCLAGGAAENIVKEGLSGLTELCVPDLALSSLTATIHPIGLVTDDVTPDFTKCIKRINGATYVNGVPYFSTLQPVDPTDLINFNKIISRKTNGELAYVPPYGNWPGLVTGKVYGLYVKKGESERLVESNPFIIKREILFANSNAQDSSTWPSFPDDNDLEKDIILNASYNDVQLHADEFNILLKLEFAALSPTVPNASISVSANGHRITYYQANALATMMVATVIIPIQRSDLKLSLRASKEDVDISIHYQASIEGYYP